MSTEASASTIAWMVALAGTFACVAVVFLWAVTTAHPARRRAHLVGRPAEPYWYTPSGLQDERGIEAMPVGAGPAVDHAVAG